MQSQVPLVLTEVLFLIKASQHFIVCDLWRSTSGDYCGFTVNHAQLSHMMLYSCWSWVCCGCVSGKTFEGTNEHQTLYYETDRWGLLRRPYLSVSLKHCTSLLLTFSNRILHYLSGLLSCMSMGSKRSPCLCTTSTTRWSILPVHISVYIAMLTLLCTNASGQLCHLVIALQTK